MQLSNFGMVDYNQFNVICLQISKGFCTIPCIKHFLINEGNQKKVKEIKSMEKRLSFNLATSIYNTN